MSNLILPDKPAFATLRPGIPKFIPRDRKDLTQALVSRLGSGQLLCRADAAETEELSGYYLFRYACGKTSFVKVVAEQRAVRQFAADAVAGWVAGFGVRTPQALPGFPVRLGQEHVIFAYQYIVSRFADTSPSDLRSIGQALAVMHVALAKRSDVAETRRLSAVRVSMLKKRCQIVCAGTYLPESRMSRVRAILESEASAFNLLDDTPGSQSLHGDLVYGNILFPVAGGDPVILDFEDSAVSWLPVAFDLSQVLERFVLLSEQNDENALALGGEMLSAYTRAMDQEKRGLACHLSVCLRLLAARALATLAEIEAQGREVETSEWDKFLNLYRHALVRASLLNRLEEQYLA